MKRNIVVVIVVLLMVGTGFTTYQLIPTNLRVTVISEENNAFVEGASVSIYTTEADFNNRENHIGEIQTTDRRGRTTFRKLEAAEYYIYAEKGDLNNIGMAVRTDSLEAGKINVINIIIN